MELTLIKQFLDEEGRITQMPTKLKKRTEVLKYLATKFELDCTYSEQQVNEICMMWSTFSDHVLLRRELVDAHFLMRELDCSKYWRVYKEPEASDE